MIIESEFKKCKCIQLENEVLKILILPELGGKVASIFRKDKSFELLFQNKEDQYKSPELYADFEEFDASGFDDAFPSIDAGEVYIVSRKVMYPDHGEIWSSAFTYKIVDEKIIMNYESRILPYSYKKTLYLESDSLRVEYEIINRGNEDIPCIWAMHCLINCEEDMQLQFPKDTKGIENVHQSDYLGDIGTYHSFPIAKDLKGNNYRLDRIMAKTSKKCEKYYVKGKILEGVCGAYYPDKGVHFRVYYDKEKLPYLGFWVTESGFRGDYNCALEPTNGYYDSIDVARSKNTLFLLEKNKVFQFSLKIELK